MLTEILPAGRTWPQATEDLAGALIKGAASDRFTLAGLALLFADPDTAFARGSLANHYMHRLHVGIAVVRWVDLSAAAASGLLDLTSRQRALIAVACSLANEHCPVQLGDALGNLTDTDRAAFLAAVDIMAGGRSA